MQTADSLLALGKKAAQKFLEQSIPLNDSIREIKQAHSLTDEETRRVVERANVAVNLHLFHNAPVDDKATYFKVANAEEILGSEKKASLGYYPPPEGSFQRTKFGDAPSMEELYKVAHPNLQPATLQKAASAQVRLGHGRLSLKRAHEKIAERHSISAQNWVEAVAVFRKEAMAEMRSGRTVCELLEALIPFTKEASAECLSVMKPQIEYLKQHGLVKEGALREIPPESNPNNPMIAAYRKMVAVWEDLHEKRAELALADSRLQEMDSGIANAVRT